jgi:hypothetical protein
MLAYGLDLGGPGDWCLQGCNPGDQLRTDWYDERDALARCCLCWQATRGIALSGNG